MSDGGWGGDGGEDGGSSGGEGGDGDTGGAGGGGDRGGNGGGGAPVTGTHYSPFHIKLSTFKIFEVLKSRNFEWLQGQKHSGDGSSCRCIRDAV